MVPGAEAGGDGRRRTGTARPAVPQPHTPSLELEDVGKEAPDRVHGRRGPGGRTRCVSAANGCDVPESARGGSVERSRHVICHSALGIGHQLQARIGPDSIGRDVVIIDAGRLRLALHLGGDRRVVSIVNVGATAASGTLVAARLTLGQRRATPTTGVESVSLGPRTRRPHNPRRRASP